MEEHIQEHHEGGSGAYMFLAFIAVLVVVGLLLWRFLPMGNDQEGIDVNVSVPNGDSQGY